MDNLRIYFVTWNVGTKPPPSDQQLHKLLGLSQEKEKQLNDIYVISLQEVKAQPHNMLVDILFDDPWTNVFKDVLITRGYIKIKTIRLQGLVLSVYSLKEHMLNLREIETQYTRTGISGFWGNKGAVSIRLGIYGCSLCFVNAHLSAHDDHLEDRISDYNSIIKDQEYHVIDHTQILHHDYVFWMGDLNFRLLETYEKTPVEIERDIKKGNLKELFNHDQLYYVMRKDLAFSELRENPPCFPPTFKFEVGSSDYDHKRKPAWTDRILYKVGANNYENVTLKADQNSYICHPEYMLSDHRPVSSEFNVKVVDYLRQKPDLLDTTSAQVFADYSEQLVEFDSISCWVMDESNSTEYKISQDKEASGDWIGLYKEDFKSLDEYVSYVYVSKGSSPLPATKSPHKSSGVRTKFKRAIQFPEVSVRHSGRYVLIYTCETSNNVQSILGMSNAFNIIKHDSD